MIITHLTPTGRRLGAALALATALTALAAIPAQAVAAPGLSVLVQDANGHPIAGVPAGLSDQSGMVGGGPTIGATTGVDGLVTFPGVSDPAQLTGHQVLIGHSYLLSTSSEAYWNYASETPIAITVNSDPAVPVVVNLDAYESPAASIQVDCAGPAIQATYVETPPASWAPHASAAPNGVYGYYGPITALIETGDPNTDAGGFWDGPTLQVGVPNAVMALPDDLYAPGETPIPLGNGDIVTFIRNPNNSPIDFTTSATIDCASPVERYVAAVYRDLFGRSVDPSGQATWTTLLSNGTPRIAVANAITSSPEYRSTLVTGVYRDFLDRTPDPGGLGFWVDKMAQGWTVAQIASGFISSQEYYNAAGAPADAWVAALYADVLDRGAAPSEIGFWTGRLALGHSRAEIALGFLLSTERLQTVVTGYYALLLDRTPDPTGLAFWVAMLQVGTHDEQIIGGIVASDEYYNRA